MPVFLSGSLIITGSMTTSGTITAQTLVVQTITSSIVNMTGSNIFGSVLTDRQTFTGSVVMTGSLTVNTTGTEFQVTNNGVVIGNLLTDNHSITGSLRITGSSVTLAGPLTGSSATFTGTLTATDGTQGLNVRAYTGGAGFGAIYSTGVTAGAGNFALAASSTQTILSGVDSVNLAINSAIKLAISSSGNVGIGTTSPTELLHISSSTTAAFIRFQTSAGGGVYVGNRSDNMELYAGGSERMRITSGGSVGIGTSSPETFTNYKTLEVSDTAGGVVFAKSTTSSITAQLVADNGTSSGYVGTRTNHAFSIRTNNTDRINITSGGNVGIGTTSPTYKLEVNDKSRLYNITIGGTVGGTYDAYADSVVGIGNLHLAATGSGGAVYINSAIALPTYINPVGGNVGIGTTSPASRLQIGTTTSTSTATPETLSLGGTFSSTAGSNVKFKVYDDTAGNIGGMSVSSGQTEVNTWSSGKLAFYRGTNLSMIIDASSNVGINQSSPAYKLDVTGDIRGTGNLYISTGNSTGGGIILADDGDIVDLNDAYCSMRFSYGVRIFSANRGGSAVIKLGNGGDIVASADITAYGSPSDISLKENIEPLEKALSKILKLQGVTFDWKEDSETRQYTKLKEDIGFIAQQVQEVIPELVRKNDNGLLSLRDRGLTALLVEAIKEQQSQIEELKTIINGLTK